MLIRKATWEQSQDALKVSLQRMENVERHLDYIRRHIDAGCCENHGRMGSLCETNHDHHGYVHHFWVYEDSCKNCSVTFPGMAHLLNMGGWIPSERGCWPISNSPDTILDKVQQVFRDRL